MPQRNLVVICLAGIISLACYHKAPESRYVRTLAHAMGLIEGLYVEDVTSRALFEDAMQGMVGGLDQYSAFIGASSFQQFQESLGQEFGGIGIMVEGPPRTERLTVLTPVFNTPAYHAGMQSGDVILRVDGVDTEGMTLEEAVTLMRGPRGAELELVVQSTGESQPHTLRLKRDIIPIESVLGDAHEPDGSWNYRLQEDPRLGYIRVTSFGEHTAKDLAAAIKQCGDIEGLILDLRGNAGGLLTSAVETCDMFIDQGEIVSTRGRGGIVRQRFNAQPSTLLSSDVPLVVLINRGSASASEIVAACLQDHERAIVVGQRSWGKGTVQNIIELEGGRSALKLTTASYWRPSGQNIHRVQDAKEEDEWGVRPQDGFDVAISDDDSRRLARIRRQRDVVPGKRGIGQNDLITGQTSTIQQPTAQQPTAQQPSAEKPLVETPQSQSPTLPEPTAEKPPGQSHSSDATPGDPGAGETVNSDESDDSTEPLDDPQLRKAIDYLEGRLNQNPSPVAPA